MYDLDQLGKAKLQVDLAKADAARKELLYKKMERENDVESAQGSLQEQEDLLKEVQTELANSAGSSIKSRMKLELKKAQCETNRLRVMVMIEEKREEVERIDEHVNLQLVQMQDVETKLKAYESHSGLI